MDNDLYLASRSSRLLAVLVDAFITFLFFILMSFLTGISTSDFMDSTFNVKFFMISILSILIFNVIIPTFVWKGQTLGKRWIKIAVVKDTDEEVDLITILVRSVFLFFGQISLPIISYVFNVIAFIDPLLIFRGNRKTIHDMIAKTKVIDV
ncbi:RDD family protein [Bacillus sp. JJ664]